VLSLEMLRLLYLVLRLGSGYFQISSCFDLFYLGEPPKFRGSRIAEMVQQMAGVHFQMALLRIPRRV